MADKTGIEWTDATWNPIRGCSRVSEGCRFCYAEATAARFIDPGQPYEGLAERTDAGPRWTGEIAFVDSKLFEPLRWQKPRRIFTNSMSDLFHEGLSNEEIAVIFGVMLASRRHQFQVLTKRPARARAWFEWIESRFEGTMKEGQHAGHLVLAYAAQRAARIEGLARDEVFRLAKSGEKDEAQKQLDIANEARRRGQSMLTIKAEDVHWPAPNVLLGVSVEDQAAADERIPDLMACPAALRFLSCEPLLGPVDIERFIRSGQNADGEPIGFSDAIGWVIVGGESGTGARPMHPDWARRLRNQCAEADVPFFFKQWGRWAPSSRRREIGEHGPKLDPLLEQMRWLFIDGRSVLAGEGLDLGRGELPVLMRPVGKKKSGNLLDGERLQAFPETEEDEQDVDEAVEV